MDEFWIILEHRVFLYPELFEYCLKIGKKGVKKQDKMSKFYTKNGEKWGKNVQKVRKNMQNETIFEVDCYF